MNSDQNSVTMRRIIYAVVMVFIVILQMIQSGNDDWRNLFACALFFLATLTLCKRKRQTRLLSGLLIVIILLTILIDAYAFSLSTEMSTAMLSMKMMTAMTIVQNVVFSLYLLGAVWLVRREKSMLMRLLGWGIAGYFAVRLLPATWFTLQFVASMF